MPEEIDLTEEEEEALDNVCDEDDEDWDDDEESFHILLSTDTHGRKHKPSGPGGGQFVAESDSASDSSQEVKEPTPPIEPSPTVKGSGYVHLREHKKAVKKAIEKLKIAPLPTEQEIEAAKVGIAKKGANMFRKDLIGNTRNRRDRRNKLLEEFGDGETCPCLYCGLSLTHGTMEQDKIYTTLEGGRYRTPNLVPSCGDCNKKRGDMPFTEALKVTVSYIKHKSET